MNECVDNASVDGQSRFQAANNECFYSCSIKCIEMSARCKFTVYSAWPLYKISYVFAVNTFAQSIASTNTMGEYVHQIHPLWARSEQDIIFPRKKKMLCAKWIGDRQQELNVEYHLISKRKRAKMSLIGGKPEDISRIKWDIIRSAFTLNTLALLSFILMIRAV